MASGKTENYGLSQWEATDQVIRTDFNADNEKLDVAITGAVEKANTAQKAVDNLAAVAFTLENLPFVTGIYTGNGSNCVIATQDIAYIKNEKTLFQLTDTGFIAGYYKFSSNYSGVSNMNSNDSTYVYAAFY